MKTIDKRMLWFLDVFVFILALLLDQITKSIARKSLAVGEATDVIPGVFQFLHVENAGASWGMFQGGSVVFIILALIVSIGIAVFITRIPGKTKFIRLHLSLSLIAAGAIGNVIDRIQKGTVTDFFYAQFINFPVFNVADIFIVCSTAWLMIMVLFVYKEEELDFMGSKKKSKASEKEEK
jgi:signal peptidase II